MADVEGLQCYVEASPAGYQLCQKFGFNDVAEMTIKLGKFRKGYKDYRHIVMIRPPFGTPRRPETPLLQENPFVDGQAASPTEEPDTPFMAEARLLNFRPSPDRKLATVRDAYESSPSLSPRSTNVSSPGSTKLSLSPK